VPTKSLRSAPEGSDVEVVLLVFVVIVIVVLVGAAGTVLVVQLHCLLVSSPLAHLHAHGLCVVQVVGLLVVVIVIVVVAVVAAVVVVAVLLCVALLHQLLLLLGLLALALQLQLSSFLHNLGDAVDLLDPVQLPNNFSGGYLTLVGHGPLVALLTLVVLDQVLANLI